MLSWQLYGTSDVQALEPNQLLIETLTKTESSVREKNIDIVKSIIKPELYRYFRWMPHECIFQNGQVAVLLDKKEGRINHYVNRTIEYFFQHKLAKKQHMENRLFTDEEIENFLHIGNDEEDSEFLISRFIPEVRRRMRYE